MIVGPRNVALSLVAHRAVAAAWEGFVRLLRHPGLHPADAVAASFVALYRGIASALYVEHSAITLAETLLGFALGSALGFLLGTVVALSRRSNISSIPSSSCSRRCPRWRWRR